MIDSLNQWFITSLQPLSNTFPIFEVSITPKRVFTTQFYCRMFDDKNNTYFPYSNKALVSVIEKNATGAY